MTTFNLSKPLKTHSGDVSVFTLSEPTARSFIKWGEAFKLRWTTDAKDQRQLDIEYNNAVMANFLTDMIDPKIDDIILGALSAGDYMRLRTVATDIILGVAGNENPS